MIIKTIIKSISRILQILILVFFGYWLYQKIFVGGLSFAVATLVLLPIILAGLVIGLCISAIFVIKGSKFKAVRVLNIILLLAYFASLIFIISITK